RHAQLHPTRFPYTTLFRSTNIGVRLPMSHTGPQDKVTAESSENPAGADADRIRRTTTEGGKQEENRENPIDKGQISQAMSNLFEDRKSTRLNSSHQSISYA